MTTERRREIQEATETIDNIMNSNIPAFKTAAIEEVKKKLKHFNCIFEEFDTKDKSLIVKCEGTKRKLFFSDKTCLLNDCKLQRGEKLSVIELPLKDSEEGVLVSILPEEDADMFQGSDLAESIKDICNYSKFSAPKRERIKKERRGRQYPAYDSREDARITPNEWDTYWKLTKTCRSLEEQAMIEPLLKDYKSKVHSDKHSIKAKQRLELQFGISTVNPEPEEIDAEKLKLEMNSKLPHKEKEIKELVDPYVASRKAGIGGGKYLIIGPPGTGKDAFIDAFAECTGLPTRTIDMSASVPVDIGGADAIFEDSGPGNLLETLCHWGHPNGLLHIKGLNKVSKDSKDGNACDILEHFLDGEYTDKFTEIPVSCENTMVIATCNDTDQIPKTLQERFKIIRTHEYSTQEKIDIAKKVLIPRLLKKYKLNESHIIFNDKVIKHIIRYCADFGTRDLLARLESIICRCSCENVESGYEVDIPFADEVLLETVDLSDPGIQFNRDREFYNSDVANEFMHLAPLYTSKEDAELAGISLGTVRKTVDHLIACKNLPPEEVIDPVSFRKKMSESHYGMKNVLDEVTALYYLNGHCKEAFSNLCLAGGPGTGKTSICDSIAKAMQKPLYSINLSELKEVKGLFGTQPSYKDANPSPFAEFAYKTGSLRYVLRIDEAEKANPEMQKALLTILDRKIKDEYLGCELDLKDVTIILCVNDFMALDPLVRDRVSRVNVSGYTKNDKRHILKDYLIPKLEKMYSAQDDFRIVLEEEAEDLILKSSKSSGVRDLEKNIKSIVGRRLFETYSEREGDLQISKDDVERILKPSKASVDGNFPYASSSPGIAKMLGVIGGNLGTVKAVEAVLAPAPKGQKEEMYITGMPQEVMHESCQVAYYYMKIHYPELFKGKDVYLHFSEAGIKKDGPSAGITVASALYSAAIEKPIMVENIGDIAFTGEIDITGQICPVGGIPEKLQAGNDSGCQKIFIPKGNYLQLEKEFLDELDCEVVPVENISEVIKAIFPKECSKANYFDVEEHNIKVF